MLYARFASMLSHGSESAGLWAYGLLAFTRGLGYVTSGPISAIVSTGAVGGRSGSAYTYLILFDGIAFALSAFGAVGWIYCRRVGDPS